LPQIISYAVAVGRPTLTKFKPAVWATKLETFFGGPNSPKIKKGVPNHTPLKKKLQMIQQMGITIYDDDLLMFCVVPFIFVTKI
jgi:hypothetical protein